MEIKRKPFQGVVNIIRFNRHFYLIAGIALALLWGFKSSLPAQFESMAVYVFLPVTAAIVLSLFVSCYVYDLSGFYKLEWLPGSDVGKLLNVNAGFDETSAIIKAKFPNADLSVCDFYDEEKHTEISIRRARSVYSPFAGTIQVSAVGLPFEDNTFDSVFVILSAHEIRNKAERILFFNELKRVVKSSGQIIVTEHLRDVNNFIAYSIGVFHFHSRKSWQETFIGSNLQIVNELKINPFITTFILSKNGTSH